MLGFAEKKRKKKEATAKVRVSRRTVANSPRHSVKTHQLISLEKLPKTTDVAFFKKKSKELLHQILNLFTLFLFIALYGMLFLQYHV